MVGSSQGHRGYQPDEMDEKTKKLELGPSSITQGSSIAKSPIATENCSKASATNNKLASTMASRSSEPLAPHRRTHIKDSTSNHQPFAQTQAATMDASRPELALVHFNGVSEPVESEVSSTQIIAERKPSCWLVAGPPEAPPTEWDSAAADIDRPAKTNLPIYRVPKSEHKVERDVAFSSFSRQQAKLRPQVAGSTSKAPKSHTMSGPLQLETPGNDAAQATPRVGSQKDGHTADSFHHQCQQLQQDEVSQMNVIHDKVLSGTMQASPRVQLESDELKSSPLTQNAPQAKLSENSTSSAISLQPKISQMSYSTGKQDTVVPPHLRVQGARPRPDNKNKTLLEPSASLSTAATTHKVAHDEDPERRRGMVPTMQVHKVPPHLQALSRTKPRATKGPLSVNALSPTLQAKDNSYRPTIDIDEEIALTQPVLDVDEEIVAGLRAETSGAIPGARPTEANVQGSNEQIVYVSPHTKASFSRSKASAARSRATDKEMKPQVDLDKDRNDNLDTRSNGFAVEPYSGAHQGVSSKRNETDLASPCENGAVLDAAESSVKQGKKPARENESVDVNSELVGWDGKINQPPVGDEWDRRRPFNPQGNERHLLIEAWRKEHAADPEENNRLVVDTASAHFQTGEGLAGGDVTVLSPIDKKDHETLASSDDFTQARRHRSAAEAIKHYEAKIAAKPKAIPSGIDGMTREERRHFRRALIEEERTRRVSPNPHAPTANIYLRPAEFKDMGQVTTIDNYYVRETTFVLHLETVDELYWYVYFLSALSPI